MANYFEVHKNKKPKKLKYSKPYTKQELKFMRELGDFFTQASADLKNKGVFDDWQKEKHKPIKCNHSHINSSDGLDVCIDCGASNY